MHVGEVAGERLSIREIRDGGAGDRRLWSGLTDSGEAKADAEGDSSSLVMWPGNFV